MADLYEYLLTGAPARWVGRPADVIGQYFVDERCDENQFVVTRIVVTCCLADAEVIGVRAQSSKPFKPAARATKLAPWIEVRGKLEALNDRFGNRALFIGDAAVSEVLAPDDILLYPRRRRAPW
jgi:putative membrane protein